MDSCGEGTPSAQHLPQAPTPNWVQGTGWGAQASTLSVHQHWLPSQARATHLHLDRRVMGWLTFKLGGQEPAAASANILKGGPGLLRY